MKITSVFLFTSALTGFFMNLCDITAQASILSLLPPSASLLVTITAGFCVLGMIRLFRTLNVPFFAFAILFLTAMGVLSAGFFFKIQSTPLWAAAWYFSIILANYTQAWVLEELVCRFINTAERTHFSPKVSLVYELGTIVGVGVLCFSPIQVNLNASILIAAILSTCLGITLALTYLISRPREIRFSTQIEVISERASQSFKPVLNSVILIGMSVGILQGLNSFVVNTVYKAKIGSFEEIRALIAYTFLGSSILIIITNIYSRKHSKKVRISPISDFFVFLFILGITRILAFIGSQVWVYVIFATVVRWAIKGFYGPSIGSLASGFTSLFRNRLQAMHTLFRSGLSGVPLIALTLTEDLPLTTRLVLLNLIFVAIIALLIYWTPKFRFQLTRSLYRFLKFGSKTSQIFAAFSLSFIKPRNYVEKMKALLETQPKTVLKKTIVLGLGYSWDQSLLPIMKHHLQTGREEIQIGVIKTLIQSKDPRAIRLLLECLVSRDISYRLRVRIEAAHALKQEMGNHAIPFLLSGLESENPRLVADTLQLLRMFNEPWLIPEYRRHALSPQIRVRHNALQALYSYPSQRKWFYQQITLSLESSETEIIHSALYVVGSLKQKRIFNELPLLSKNFAENQSKNGSSYLETFLFQIWASRSKSGSHFVQDFSAFIPQVIHSSLFQYFLNLYSQVEIHHRFEIIRHLVHFAEQTQDASILSLFSKYLKASDFDFHGELDFLQSIARIEYSKADSEPKEAETDSQSAA